MLKRTLLILLILSFPLVSAASTEDDGKPTVAILSYGSIPAFRIPEKGILDMLQDYGFINAEERRTLDEQRDLEGENINIVWGDAGFDFANANLMVKDALGRDVDVLITNTTTVTQIAANATLNMEDPPIVIFHIVSNPYYAGIADAPCIKPAHISGSQALTPYEKVVPLLLTLNPDMKVVGTMFNSSEANGVYGAETISAIAESIGLTVLSAAVTSVADLNTAAEGLVSKGVEAIILPSDSTVTFGLPAIMQVATQNGIPVFHTSAYHVYSGATVGAGFYSYYQEGLAAARRLIGHLTNEIDIATIGINLQSSLAVAVNLDVAKAQSVAVSEEFLALADWTIIDGESSAGVTRALPEHDIELEEMTLEARMAEDAAFLAELECTPERIAEEQAALDAAEG